MKLSIQVLAFVANLPSLTLAAPVEPVAEPQLVSDLKERNELVRRNGPVGYTIGPVGGACNSGTTFGCPSAPCKGNFDGDKGVIQINSPQSGCHISLYTGLNQGGTLIDRIDTGSTGCKHTSGAAWKSIGYFCP